jgi:putative Mg2+ transporter-C (MgtC) family protein
LASLELSFPTGFLASLEIGGRLVLAIGLAGLLGWDREDKDRPAGLRTYMLVALASALFTIITFEIYETINTANPSGSSDPIRIIEAVTAGVAFLAAGTIIQGRTSVRGLTTGAGMWMAGALGVAIGAGHYLLAIFAAVLAFCILRFVHFGSSNEKGPASTLLIEENEEDQRSG